MCFTIFINFVNLFGIDSFWLIYLERIRMKSYAKVLFMYWLLIS